MAKEYLEKSAADSFIGKLKDNISLLENYIKEIKIQIENTNSNVTVNIDDKRFKICQLSLLQIETEVKLKSHQIHLAGWNAYYNDEFLPRFEKECAEMHINFDATFAKAKEICKYVDEKSDIYILTTMYDKKEADNESKNALYKRLKELIPLFEKKADNKNNNLKVVKK